MDKEEYDALVAFMFDTNITNMAQLRHGAGKLRKTLEEYSEDIIKILEEDQEISS